MPRKSRRLSATEVREVLKLGRSKRATYLSMKFLATDTPLQVAVVVSKATAKGAVERNRLRRALYRALPPLQKSGKAVIFLQKIPTTLLQPAFSEDLMLLLSQ